MTLPRLSSRPPGPGAYTSPGAMNRLITFNTPANPTAGIPAAPLVDSWAAIRAIGGREMDKVQQFAQKSTHLITVPYQDGVFESMTLTVNEGDTTRTFQIEYLEDPDESHRELRLMCFEMGQNAGSGTSTAPPTPPYVVGTGAPVAILTNGTTYYDQSTGNLYEQVYGVWRLVGNIPTGGTEMPSSIYHVVSAASTNAANIKAAAGLLIGGLVYNNSDEPIFVKLFDKATPPVPGTDTPKQTIGVDAGLSEPVSIPGGVTYTNGIGIAIVKNIADLDSTPAAANDCVVDIFYQ